MNSFKTKQPALLIHGRILKKFQKKTFSTVSEEVLTCHANVRNVQSPLFLVRILGHVPGLFCPNSPHGAMISGYKREEFLTDFLLVNKFSPKISL